MMEPAGAAGELPRAYLRVGGLSLARHQLALALALGCERIVCQAAEVGPDLVALQHVAEAGGASFHRISGPRALVGLVSATDDLIALGEGLLAWPDLAISLLGAGSVVLVQPIESGLAAGFERLDLNHAAAGAIRIPGRLVERLGDLPPDCDTLSALQRLALQTGVIQRLLPPEAHESGRWSLIRSEGEAHAAEAAWIRLHTALGGLNAPALTLARWAVRGFGPALLHAGSSGGVVAIAGGVLALLGLVTGWFGFAAAGLVFCAMAWVLFLAAILLARVERDSLRMPHPVVAPGKLYGWMLDGSLALLIAWNSTPVHGGLARFFAPVMLLGLARLVPRVIGGGWAHWLEDRGLLALVLALGAAAGLLGALTDWLAVAALLGGLVAAGRSSRLTPA